MQIEYECAVSGLSMGSGHYDDSDGLGDLPVGWTRVHLARRQYNPKWILIQQVKEAMIEGLLEQFGEGALDFQKYAVSLQIEAQFHSLEGATPMYMTDVDEIVYISNSGDIVESINEMRETLGLEGLPVVEELPDVTEEEDTAMSSEEAEDEEEAEED